MAAATVYRQTYRITGLGLVKGESLIRGWGGWPDDVREVVRGWNQAGRLRFVYLPRPHGGRAALYQGDKGDDPVLPPVCPDCREMFDSTGSTAAKLDGDLVCDDCVAARARLYGPAGRPETELEKAKRWQRGLQAKLDRMRHNARTERGYVRELKRRLRWTDALQRRLDAVERVLNDARYSTPRVASAGAVHRAWATGAPPLPEHKLFQRVEVVSDLERLAGELADAAAHACVEPREFLDSADLQGQLSHAVALVRRALRPPASADQEV